MKTLTCPKCGTEIPLEEALAIASAAAEEQRLRLSEKEKLIGELYKQIEALKQKAEQGSQRLQGEILELEVESLLKEKFFSDEIRPISNGVRGADLLHRVRTTSGPACGNSASTASASGVMAAPRTAMDVPTARVRSGSPTTRAAWR